MPNRRDDDAMPSNPRTQHEIMLRYKERHQGWHIFRALFWSIYFVVMGFMLIYYNAIGFTTTLFLGVAFIIFAVMLILYGLTEALHHKLMKKYG